MPNNGIAKILADKTPHPESGNGIPRCELYFYVEDIALEFNNAVNTGAKLINAIQDRTWGDKACYFADPDGHIIAFAEKLKCFSYIVKNHIYESKNLYYSTSLSYKLFPGTKSIILYV